MAAQPRQFPAIGRTNAGVDTTLTKIFVGGLAWETQDHTMRRYFDQFGEILEAVVITDKHTGRSKGYGFVTFKDPDSAMRACHDPTPVIDGRRANCNLASLGAAQRTPQHGIGRFRPPMASPLAPRGPNAAASTAYFHPHAQHAYPYSFYGYSGGYSQQSMHPMSYYGIGRGQQQQQYSPYYPASPGFVHGFYPYYPQYAHSSQTATGFVPNYAQIPQYPYYGSGAGIISLPSSIAAITTGGAPVVTIAAGSTSQQRGVIPDLKPPA